MIGFIGIAMLSKQEVPEPVTALVSLRRAVLQDEVTGKIASRPWRLTKSSWAATWGQSTFGVGQVGAVDTSAFGFRVPPDSDRQRYGGGSPFLVEAYQDGFPTYGIRRDGTAELCRPLGFVYGPDGMCKNATVFKFDHGSWKKLSLTHRTTTLLARRLNYFAPSKISDFTTPWFKIVAQGYGDYFVDHGLNCIGPFGISCKLLPGQEEDLGMMLSGNWEPQAGR